MLLQQPRFSRRWENRGKPNEYRNAVYMELCRRAAELNVPIMDIACGPGLGLLPDINALNPGMRALAVDASPLLIEKWSGFLGKAAPQAPIRFACFNAADMPLRSDSLDGISGNIGFSSLRYAGPDQMLGIKEAHRVLKSGGHVFAVENEFENMAVIQRAFDLWGKENWFSKNTLSWRERFQQAGFTIEWEMPLLRRVENTDWDLGEFAASQGLEIVTLFTAYILRK